MQPRAANRVLGHQISREPARPPHWQPTPTRALLYNPEKGVLRLPGDVGAHVAAAEPKPKNQKADVVAALAWTATPSPSNSRHPRGSTSSTQLPALPPPPLPPSTNGAKRQGKDQSKPYSWLPPSPTTRWRKQPEDLQLDLYKLVSCTAAARPDRRLPFSRRRRGRPEEEEAKIWPAALRRSGGLAFRLLVSCSKGIGTNGLCENAAAWVSRLPPVRRTRERALHLHGHPRSANLGPHVSQHIQDPPTPSPIDWLGQRRTCPTEATPYIDSIFYTDSSVCQSTEQ